MLINITREHFEPDVTPWEGKPVKHDRTRCFRLDGLATDAAELRRFAGRIEALIDDMRLAARMMQSDATGEAVTAAAGEIADAMHGAWAAVIVAHDAACDEEGKEPMYVIDPDTARAFDMKVTP